LSSLVDRISDWDDDESARKHRVAQANNIIFAALVKELQGEISRYNERHPQDRFAPNAIVMNYSNTSTEWSAGLEKTTKPTSSVKLDFPFNTGALTFAASSGEQDSIALDFQEGAPVFYLYNEWHCVREAAEFLLKLLLAPDEEFEPPKRKIGF
jgi:hypothetical protein